MSLPTLSYSGPMSIDPSTRKFDIKVDTSNLFVYYCKIRQDYYESKRYLPPNV